MCVAFGCDFFCCASNLLNAERSVRSQTAAANIFFIANVALRASCRALTINRISNSRPVIYSSAAVVCRHIFVTMCMPVANRNGELQPNALALAWGALFVNKNRISSLMFTNQFFLSFVCNDIQCIQIVC